MHSATLLLPVVLLLSVVLADAARADRLSNAWPTCSTASAIEKIIAGYWRFNDEEVERLGCIRTAPRTVLARAIRCAPSVADHEAPMFSYPVERDPDLPEDVCEIEVSLPDGWTATLFTHFANIW